MEFLKLLRRFLRHSYSKRSNQKRTFLALRTLALFERDYLEGVSRSIGMVKKRGAQA